MSNIGKIALPIQRHKPHIIATNVDSETFEFLNKLSDSEGASRSAILRAMILTFKEEFRDEQEQG